MRAKMRRLSSTQNWSVKGSEAMVENRERPQLGAAGGRSFSFFLPSLKLNSFLTSLKHFRVRNKLRTDFEEDEKIK